MINPNTPEALSISPLRFVCAVFLCACPLHPNASDTGTSWLRLEHAHTDQGQQLDRDHQEYLRQVEPLTRGQSSAVRSEQSTAVRSEQSSAVRSEQSRAVKQQLAGQQQRQQLLQTRQQREQSMLRHRLNTSRPLTEPSIRNNYQLQRFRQQQQGLRNYQQMQRQSWPGRR